MASSLEIRDAAASAPVSTSALGVIPVGSDYGTVAGSLLQRTIYNKGDTTATNVTLSIKQRLTAGFESFTIYLDNGSGAPNTSAPIVSTDGAVALADIAAASSVNIWLDASVPSGSSNGAHDATISLLFT